MHRFREHWLALFGGILLLTLSVSSVFGAPPTDAEGNRGQSISTFVHTLVFGDQGANDPTEGDEEQAGEESPEDELNPDEDEVEGDEASEADPEAAASHGACVSAIAKDKEAVGGPNDNHGGAVSEAARVTCWDDEAEDTEEGDTEDEAVDEGEVGAHGARVSEVARDKAAVGGPNDNHGGAVSEAARVTCWDAVVADGDEATVAVGVATAADVDSGSTDAADRPGKGNGRDKADRPGKGGRGNGRGHR